jgi:hypothetical protein
MILAAPIWLLGLIPWLALAVWMLLGKPSSAGVPFLPLWRATSAHQHVARAWKRPPWAVMWLLMAMLLAVLAAIKPTLPGKPIAEVTVILDRGATMSARVGGRPRFIGVAENIASHLSPATRVALVDLISGERSTFDGGHLLSGVVSMPRTGINTGSLARPGVVSELARSSASVWLLSDHSIHVEDSRFAQVKPDAPLQNVGIVQLSAREGGTAQVMVEVMNDSIMTRAQLRITSGAGQVTRSIDLPPQRERRKYFVDLDHPGERIEATLQPGDDLEADNTAWLVREANAPRLEVRGTISSALQRMVAIYSKTRPPRQASATVAIVQEKASLASAEIGAIVAPAFLTTPLAGLPRVVEHPVTAVVNWPTVIRDASVAGPPPEGWEALVAVGDHVVLASRSNPARQLWVGFESADWERSADYVVFWSNAFSWLAGGGEDFAAHPVTVLDRQWTAVTPVPADAQPNAWPGVYRRADGVLHAMNVESVTPQAEVDDRSGSRVGNLATHSVGNSIAPWLGFCALSFALLAAASWQSA